MQPRTKKLTNQLKLNIVNIKLSSWKPRSKADEKTASYHTVLSLFSEPEQLIVK